ncbi:MAG: zinc dependent phospholipase C family protein [Candidatus Tenebribacter burtonii]|jgi:hypothetical protein|nr:zinc dependent phospholipase C family protein [Candidatus Tenebribacter burtonii]
MWIWDSRTHQFIVAKALKKCYPPFANMLKIHQELFILGIQAPDRIFKDFTNHYYNCIPNKYGYHFGSVIKKINNELQLLNKMVAGPNTIHLHPVIAPFLVGILDTPLKAFIFELGVVSHYIADLHQPFHTDGSDRFPDEETVHQIMEADTRKHLDDFTLDLERRHKITNPLEYFTEQIYHINEYYDELINNYYLRKGKVKPDRWDNSFTIIQECMKLAAQNIANIYLSFERSNKIFESQIHHAKLIKKIGSSLDSKSKYYLKKYRSGTVSIREK